MVDRAARGILLGLLGRLRGGRIEIAEGGRTMAFGPGDSDLTARVEVADERAWTWTLRGSTGWGEGYVDRLWDCDDLVALARIVARNLAPLDRWRRRAHPLLGRLQRAVSLVPRNSRRGARRNISAHYDLGNPLFEAFLDPRLVYSCAVFEDPGMSLSEAQVAKLERACAWVDLGPDDHLLEIGTGWGALAIHAATTRGCRVTTTTISREQHAHASELVRELGLDDRVEVVLMDYRDLRGRFDKLVSIEMIEAVGWQYFEQYFETCSRLLEPGGAMFLQAIVIDDDCYEAEKASRSFSNKHIFPGGCLPSERLIAELTARRTDMRIARSEDITPSYATTLASWRTRFNDSWRMLERRGYDDRFRRLWNFYLASSEAGFRERRIRDLEFLLAKPRFDPGRSGGLGLRALLARPDAGGALERTAS
ncbi:MAG: class I SAM-dependent methyltransferase [Solirubrobacterales bacterium]